MTCWPSLQKALHRTQVIIYRQLQWSKRKKLQISKATYTCVASPTKKIWKADFPDKSTTGSTSTSVFFTYDVPYFRHNSGVTSNRKVHHPAIESLVLSLQCGKATAVFVSSRDRDFVAEGGKCGSRLLDLFSLVLLWPSVFLTAPPSMSSTRTYEY